MSDTSTPAAQDSPAATEPAPAAPTGASADAVAKDVAAPDPAADKDLPKVGRNIAVFNKLRAREKELVKREEQIKAHEKALTELEQLKNALRGGKATEALALLGTDYISLGELVRGESPDPETMTADERTRFLVAKELEERAAAEKKAKEAEEARLSAEADKVIDAAKAKYVETLKTVITSTPAAYATVAALGKTGLDMARQLFEEHCEAALENDSIVIPAPAECLAMVEAHMAGKLRPAAAKETKTEPSPEIDGHTVDRIRHISSGGLQRAQPARVRPTDAADDDGMLARLKAAGLLPSVH